MSDKESLKIEFSSTALKEIAICPNCKVCRDLATRTLDTINTLDEACDSADTKV